MRPPLEFSSEEESDILFQHQVLLQTPAEIGCDYGVSGSVVRRILNRTDAVVNLRSNPARSEISRESVRTHVRALNERRFGTNLGKSDRIYNWEYREFRRKVMERDRFRCKSCISNEELIVHHILPVRDFPEKILDPDNGITLCRRCHSVTIGNEYNYLSIISYIELEKTFSGSKT